MSHEDPFPSGLESVLPHETRAAWKAIVSHLPDGAYLVGGTALAVHLGHRLSRDLDFFTAQPFDPEKLDARLTDAGDFEPTEIEPGTLNGMLGGTKIQVLDASNQRMVESPITVARIDIAQVPDLLAMKLKVIGDRGELRDYFDVKAIEMETGYRAEQGIDFYIHRYHPRPPGPSVAHIIEGLGYFGDVADDPSLPEPRPEIERYWRKRQPQVAASASRLALS